MGKTFRDYGSIPWTAFRYDTATDGTFKSEFSYFGIGCNSSDFGTALEEEADVNEKRNEGNNSKDNTTKS